MENANSGQGSVTNWIATLQDGNQQGIEGLWQRYYEQLIQKARQVLRNAPKRVAAEDDVVAMAFADLWKGVSAGRFPKLSDRHGLWKLLLTITERRAIDAVRRQNWRSEVGESVFVGPPGSHSVPPGIEQAAVSPEPTPEFAAEVSENIRLLLDGLDDPVLQRVAILKMQGYSNEEIATTIEYSLRTVERKLECIRDRWVSLGVDAHRQS